MITLLHRSFMPIISLVEKMHTDFKVGDQVPTKVKCIHMEKTILALYPNASPTSPELRQKWMHSLWPFGTGRLLI